MAVILVIEDDQIFARTLEGMLRTGGHEAVLAGPSDDIGEIVEAKEPAIAICDVWLGQTDGLAVARRIREVKPELPVILMSGGGGRLPLETVTAIADMRGVSDVLYKPFRMETLLNAVAAAL